jgi:tetratricopeptide (TPR) repeat protein
MRWPSTIALAVLAAAFSAAAFAQTREENVKRCEDTDSADTVIAGCTALIDLKTERPADLSFAYAHRGFAYNMKGMADRALRDFEEAIRLDHRNDNAYFGRGNVFYNRSDYERALLDFGRAIALNPNVARYFRDRADTYDNLGHFEFALSDYDAALRLDPNDASIYYNRGLAYADKSRNDRALADFNQAIKIKPGYTEAIAARAKITRSARR